MGNSVGSGEELGPDGAFPPTYIPGGCSTVADSSTGAVNNSTKSRLHDPNIGRIAVMLPHETMFLKASAEKARAAAAAAAGAGTAAAHSTNSSISSSALKGESHKTGDHPAHGTHNTEASSLTWTTATNDHTLTTRNTGRQSHVGDAHSACTEPNTSGSSESDSTNSSSGIAEKPDGLFVSSKANSRRGQKYGSWIDAKGVSYRQSQNPQLHTSPAAGTKVVVFPDDGTDMAHRAPHKALKEQGYFNGSGAGQSFTTVGSRVDHLRAATPMTAPMTPTPLHGFVEEDEFQGNKENESVDAPEGESGSSASSSMQPTPIIIQTSHKQTLAGHKTDFEARSGRSSTAHTTEPAPSRASDPPEQQMMPQYDQTPTPANNQLHLRQPATETALHRIPRRPAVDSATQTSLASRGSSNMGPKPQKLSQQQLIEEINSQSGAAMPVRINNTSGEQQQKQQLSHNATCASGQSTESDAFTVSSSTIDDRWRPARSRNLTPIATIRINYDDEGDKKRQTPSSTDVRRKADPEVTVVARPPALDPDGDFLHVEKPRRSKTVESMAHSENTGTSTKTTVNSPGVSPASKMSAAVSPPSKMSAIVSPASKMSAAVSPASKMSAAVSPASKMSATVSPASKMSATVSPASKVSATVSPASKVSATVSPARKLSVAVSPTSKVSAAGSPARRMSVRDSSKSEPILDDVVQESVIEERQSKAAPPKKYEQEARVPPLDKIRDTSIMHLRERNTSTAQIPQIRAMGSLISDEEEDELDEFDMDFIEQYEKFFSDFLWQNPNLVARNPDLMSTLRIAKLQKVLEVTMDAETRLHNYLENLKNGKDDKAGSYHARLIEASRQKAAREIRLQDEVQTVAQATKVMEGRLEWQMIALCDSRAKAQQQQIKELFDRDTSSNDLLRALPDLPETQAIRDAVTAPPGTDLSEEQEKDVRQFQVDNAFLNAEVALLEKKLAQLQLAAKKHGWVDSVFLRMDDKRMKRLNARHQKKLGIMF